MTRTETILLVAGVGLAVVAVVYYQRSAPAMSVSGIYQGSGSTTLPPPPYLAGCPGCK